MADKRPQYAARAYWKEKYEAATYRNWTSSVHRDAAQLGRIVEDVGMERLRALIDYYMEVASKPDFMYFVYNYDKVGEALDERTEERRRSEVRREATRRRMKELGIEV